MNEQNEQTNTQEKIKPTHSRVDVYLYPEDVHADTANNSSRWGMHSEEDIEDRCESFRLYGQLQPVMIRRIAGQFHLVAGFLRHAAMLRFNQKYPDERRKLSCQISTVSDVEAVERNITENLDRKDLSPIDKAHGMRRLQERYQRTGVQIAQVYKCAQSYVSNLIKLTTLPDHVQLQVHTGEMPVAAALELCELQPADRDAVLANIVQDKAVQDTGNLQLADKLQLADNVPSKRGKGKKKISTETVRDAVRKHRENTGSGERNPPRTLKNMRELFIAIQKKEKKESGDGKPVGTMIDFANMMLRFIDGELTEQIIIKRLGDMLA